ncbi:hypothetical protein ACSMX9_01650 [Streptomyces sp. LE64]|uniref:hypothetical protein n=1 Tax=Streptomyces sp. LE64 TaxID=3448653 RepID=UPI004042C591
MATEDGGWQLGGTERQLDAEVVQVAPHREFASPAPESGDLLLYVTRGNGHLESGSRLEAVDTGCVSWVPPGSRYVLTAGPEGLAFLAVGARAVAPPSPAPEEAHPYGGEPACLLHRVCTECGRLATGLGDRYCARCGTPLPS